MLLFTLPTVSHSIHSLCILSSIFPEFNRTKILLFKYVPCYDLYQRYVSKSSYVVGDWSWACYTHQWICLQEAYICLSSSSLSLFPDHQDVSNLPPCTPFHCAEENHQIVATVILINCSFVFGGKMNQCFSIWQILFECEILQTSEVL